MPGPSQQPRVIRFGLYEADLSARELRRDGSKVKLQDRPFEVLTILVERPGEVVGREEFRQRLWSADTFVDFDSSLNTSINKLRQALSDDAENPKFIATAGRRGYRFIAPVTVVPENGFGAERAAALPPQQATDAAVRAGSPQRTRRVRITTIIGIVAIASVATILALRFMPQPTAKVLNIVRISHNGHLDPWGRVATDGARLFFLERAGGHWNVMQVPASGGEAEIFPEPSQNTRLVDTSPDRSQFLSFSFLIRGFDLPLSLTPVVGGPSRRVGNLIADDGVFSPDGRRIFFTKADGIYSCELDGSHLQRLVALPDRSANPQWSRDGRRLRFTLLDQVHDRSSIWEVEANGSNLHPLFANMNFPGQECCGIWSADGRYFFFDSTRDGVRSIWGVRESKASLFAPAAKPVQLTFGPQGFGTAMADANGSRLFAWGGAEQHDLVRYELGTQKAEPLLPDIHAAGATLSADGSWAAFPSGGSIWKSRPDGSQRQSVASGVGTPWALQWSPDGRQILFATTQGKEFGRVFIVSSDGGPPTEISLGNGHNEPRWSPDGHSIVYGKWPEEGGVAYADSGIYSHDLQSAKTTKIPGSEGLMFPLYSPDKRFLVAVTAAYSNKVVPEQVKLFDTRKQTWTEIGVGTIVNPVTWSADSKYVYYQDILGENEPVSRYAARTKNSERFFDFAKLLRAGYVRCAFEGFAPNGDVMAWLSRSDSDLYRLDLDLP
jgi:Tol biopolymer transport system component/DNA-binding winged helix-turn-helix (wHTH) protein